MPDMFWRLRAVLRSPRGWPGQGPAVAAALAAVGLVVSGCGAGSGPRSPAVAAVPLVPGTRIVLSVRRCNQGAHPFCARELILAAAASHYEDSGVLKVAERRALSRAGWRRSEGDTYDESAAESPGNRLRVTYATAEQDLLSIDERRIARTPAITRQLAEVLFAREPALSLLVQAGSG
jgi:hypothetical protein